MDSEEMAFQDDIGLAMKTKKISQGGGSAGVIVRVGDIHIKYDIIEKGVKEMS
jgi:hypothetical protein